VHEMAADFPDFAEWVEETVGRMLDLLKPFRILVITILINTAVLQSKNLPAITGKGYDYLTINNGDAASGRF